MNMIVPVFWHIDVFSCSNFVLALQVSVVRLTSTNVLVIHVNKAERVRIKLIDLHAAVPVDSQVDFIHLSSFLPVFC